MSTLLSNARYPAGVSIANVHIEGRVRLVALEAPVGWSITELTNHAHMVDISPTRLVLQPRRAQQCNTRAARKAHNFQNEAYSRPQTGPSHLSLLRKNIRQLRGQCSCDLSGGGRVKPEVRDLL